MSRNRALQILESGEFKHLSREAFVDWVRDLQDAPFDDSNNATDYGPPPEEASTDCFTEEQFDCIGDTLSELRREALDRERTLLKRISFLEEVICDGDDTTVKHNATYDGRSGTLYYYDDQFRPTSEAAATRAKMLFNDGTWKSLVERKRSDDNVVFDLKEWKRRAA